MKFLLLLLIPAISIAQEVKIGDHFQGGIIFEVKKIKA